MVFLWFSHCFPMVFLWFSLRVWQKMNLLSTRCNLSRDTIQQCAGVLNLGQPKGPSPDFSRRSSLLITINDYIKWLLIGMIGLYSIGIYNGISKLDQETCSWSNMFVVGSYLWWTCLLHGWSGWTIAIIVSSSSLWLYNHTISYPQVWSGKPSDDLLKIREKSPLIHFGRDSTKTIPQIILVPLVPSPFQTTSPTTGPAVAAIPSEGLLLASWRQRHLSVLDPPPRRDRRRLCSCAPWGACSAPQGRVEQKKNVAK